MSFIYERLNSELQKRSDANALRILRTENGLIDFCSNDYLGFASNEQLKENILNAIEKLHKLGSTGSRLLTGNHSLPEKLENDLAKFHDAEAALFFNSGYEANSGLLSTITKRNDIIVYDELIHASLREGIRLSNAKSFSFQHNDFNDLEKQLQNTGEHIFIVVESVYSMDGDICPLKEIVALAEKYHAEIILDEAHATGVIGERGEGLAQYINLHKKIFARVHTFGKAIGFNGAAVFGAETLKKYLINFCRPFIYTTAPNLMQIVAVSEAYKYMQTSKNILEGLKENCLYFKEKMKQNKNLLLLHSDSAIFNVVIPGNEAVKLAAKFIENEGFDVRPILSPTVGLGKERLRICLHSFNMKSEIDRIVELLDQMILLINSEKTS